MSLEHLLDANVQLLQQIQAKKNKLLEVKQQYASLSTALWERVKFIDQQYAVRVKTPYIRTRDRPKDEVRNWIVFGLQYNPLGYTSKQLPTQHGIDMSDDWCGSSPTVNLHEKPRHVGDPFTDVFKKPADFRPDSERKLVIISAPLNADEKQVGPIARLYGTPYRRTEWNTHYDSTLMTLVESHRLRVDDANPRQWPEKDILQRWCDVAALLEEMEDRAFSDGDCQSKLPMFTGLGCRARWHHVLYPLAGQIAMTSSQNRSVRMLSAEEYTSITSNAWPPVHDERLLQSVVLQNGVLGREFWFEIIAQHPPLKCHALFSIIARFQSQLNSLHSMDVYDKTHRFQRLAQSVIERRRQEGNDYNRLLLRKRDREAASNLWTSEELALIKDLSTKSGDNINQYLLYIAACYDAADEKGMGPPLPILTLTSMINVRAFEKVKLKALQLSTRELSETKPATSSTFPSQRLTWEEDDLYIWEII